MAAPQSKLPLILGQSMEAGKDEQSINGGMAMGATLCMLNNQWDKAVKARDWALVDRLDDMIEKIKVMGVPAVCADHCPTVSMSALPLVANVLPLFCKWENTETCKTCPAPEAGKCPVIAVDVAA